MLGQVQYGLSCIPLTCSWKNSSVPRGTVLDPILWEDGIHVVFIFVTPVRVCSISSAIRVVIMWGVEEVQVVESP